MGQREKKGGEPDEWPAPCNTNIDLTTKHGRIRAGGGPVGISFVWFARLLSDVCFAAFVDASFPYYREGVLEPARYSPTH